ncbi:uncharacterized protein LOC143560903 [Bidens hawaiensis]|uniref:uncharacterized protein LOC143560903 n=1 Tax=Bidens hawaiensis TaxID=980011 RepID=UPI00404AD7B2
MPAVAGIGQTRFRDTCAEAKMFFDYVKGTRPSGHVSQNQTEKARGTQYDQQHINACMDIYNVWTKVPPASIKGHRSKSLLFDGCILAKEVMEISTKDTKLDKWGILSKVWLELLFYAASHSRANMLAAQASRGGELITIVWLLLTHFGLGDQFQTRDAEIKSIISDGK